MHCCHTQFFFDLLRRDVNFSLKTRAVTNAAFARRRELWEPRQPKRVALLAHTPCPLEVLVARGVHINIDPVLFPELMWLAEVPPLKRSASLLQEVRMESRNSWIFWIPLHTSCFPCPPQVLCPLFLSPLFFIPHQSQSPDRSSFCTSTSSLCIAFLCDADELNIDCCRAELKTAYNSRPVC